MQCPTNIINDPNQFRIKHRKQFKECHTTLRNHNIHLFLFARFKMTDTQDGAFPAQPEQSQKWDHERIDIISISNTRANTNKLTQQTSCAKAKAKLKIEKTKGSALWFCNMVRYSFELFLVYVAILFAIVYDNCGAFYYVKTSQRAYRINNVILFIYDRPCHLDDLTSLMEGPGAAPSFQHHNPQGGWIGLGLPSTILSELKIRHNLSTNIRTQERPL